MKMLVTGGAGFIGSAFVRFVLAHRPEARVVTYDKLTYAGNLENLSSVRDHARHDFVRGDVCDAKAVATTLAEHDVEVVVHFAAESHVDRSILSPNHAVETNVLGTAALLAAAREKGVHRFLLVSTDEVYGSIDEPVEADETFPLVPSSPYSASKAGADLLALAYVRTFGLPLVITRATNNYGPFQFPEKLIPLMISNALAGESLPIYGDGLQVRDWLHVDDHCRGVLATLERGRVGEVYNIGGGCPLTNLDVVKRVLKIVGAPESLMRRVTDRPGHDRRYAVRCDKIRLETGFAPQVAFDAGLAETVEWYRQNTGWVDRVRSGEYREFYEKNYAWRSTPHSTGA
jgi:dTDP-glucose 4,6-dehydratase